MYVVSIIFVVLNYVEYTKCSVLYETGYNHLTKLLLEALSETATATSIEERWIEQPIDHFNNDSRTWKMRYFERLEFVKPGAPIYIFLGGEGEANPSFLTAGVIKDLAEETGGAMYMTEHRYYGKSRPFNNTSTENMKWLSAKQALADTAQLIKFLKVDKYRNSKVVVIGGSYAANLATWLRLKYPYLVDAALASSAPVLGKKDFYEYLEKVNENYELYGTPDCLDNIKNMFKKYKTMFQSQEGIKQLKKEQSVCEKCDLSDSKNQMVFFMTNISPFMSNSQYGGPKNIAAHCSYLDSIQNLNTSDYKNVYNAGEKCYDYSFSSFIDYFKGSNFLHSWYYQVCTEFGYFQTTSSDMQPFGHVLPESFYLEICKEVFGPSYDEKRVEDGVNETNNIYSGLKPNVNQVVFVNGDVDPWSTLGVLEDISYESPAVVIPAATHCADLFLRPDATEELKEAYKHNKYLIKKWIGFGDECGRSSKMHKGRIAIWKKVIKSRS